MIKTWCAGLIFALGAAASHASICEKFQNTKSDAGKWVSRSISGIAGTGGTVAGTVAVAAANAPALGVTAVAHSSGAMILTGSSGYVAGTIGPIATGVSAASAAPLVIGGLGAVFVVGGGFMIYCAMS